MPDSTSLNQQQTSAARPSEASESTWRPTVQVPTSHYMAQYEEWDKWLSYLWQIRNIARYESHDVLEIGVGSQVVTSYLRRIGVHLTTLDIDPGLHPDYVGSVTELPFPDNSFDAILCTEVLEHMPYDQSERAMREIYRCTRRFAYIGVPYFVLSFALLTRLPLVHLRELRLRVPWPRRIGPVTGQHYWECGKRGYPPSRLKRSLSRAGFRTVREIKIPTNYSSILFELEK